MGTEGGKRLSELRVCDLKVELEKRSLETTGVKMDLVKRLQEALIEENIDPDDHIFTLEVGSPKKRLNSSQKSDNTNGDESFILEASGEEGLDTDDLIVKDEADDDDDEIVDEVGEIDKESFVDELEKSSSDIQRLNNEANNGENEDSLNLTIGEDEEKIFQDEDTEEKSKEKPEKAEKETTDVSKSTTAGTKVSNENGDDKSSNKASADKEDAKSAKKDDSDQKTSTTKSSTKDDKETASKSSKTKASSSSSGSRNLWVSGLSSLTRATDLKIIFSKYGKVVGAKVVTNTRTPGTRCYGLVTMGSTSDASKCIEHLHRTELHGRIISVERTKSDICVSKPTKADGEKKADTASDRKKTEKEVKKDDSTAGKESSVNGDKPADAKKREVTAERKRENAHPQRQRITARISREQNEASSAPRRPPHRPRPATGDVLSFQKIRDERERQLTNQRLRERERKLREEERRRVEARRRQREEEERLLRERERLKKERLRLEREKADLLRLERERQKLEREKIELERLELKRQQLKIEEAKRAIKRPAEHDRYADSDRKRSASDRRFEPPPPPRFDTSISSRSSAYDSRSSDKKRLDDYSTSKRDDYKRDEYKRDPFKRPVSDYPKRDLDSARHTTSSSYDARSVPVHRSDAISSSSSKDRYAMGPSQSSFNSRVRDERDTRASNLPTKSRYLDSTSSDSRYPDERSGGASWGSSVPSSTVKPFSHMQSVAGNDPWGQNKTDSSWRSLDQNEDRYDRTYNERKSQVTSSQYIDPPRQNSFIGRPQDRYNSQISSRFENGRF
ncbi:SAFB-like transcription modulator isoform X2 [Bradysia coprophila]|uniref:SAFB-like transcription modulator isoform X2 n=1 Tax=Bradysia coprophila TaxID=38358 RepID=UPI00187DA5CD|nr:SAFB-like transcription modulator isoform X2 [Bradysia coprophila]